jgi:hypothetical protein
MMQQSFICPVGDSAMYALCRIHAMQCQEEETLMLPPAISPLISPRVTELKKPSNTLDNTLILRFIRTPQELALTPPC